MVVFDDLFLEPSFWILSLTLNFLFEQIKVAFDVKWKDHVPFKMFYRGILWCLSFLFVLGLEHFEQIKLISDSSFITSLWIAFMSIMLYDFGYRKVIMVLKEKFSKQIEK